MTNYGFDKKTSGEGAVFLSVDQTKKKEIDQRQFFTQKTHLFDPKFHAQSRGVSNVRGIFNM